MSLLVRTPLPYTTESLLGFVLRVAEANGYKTPWYALRLAGIEQRQMLTAGFPVERFASVLGHRVEDLLHLSYQAGEGNSRHFKILGHSLGQSLKEAPLRLREPAFCPLCAQEDGYIDAFWDLSSAVACPKHHCETISHCSNCGIAISWFRPALLTCECGANLSESPFSTVEPALAELMGLIQAKLHGHLVSGLANTAGFPVAFFEQTPLASLLAILDCLGTHNLRLGHASSFDKNQSTIAAAIAPLAQWPAGYHQFLKRLGDHFLGEDSSTAGLRKQFKPFYESMFKNRPFARDAAFLRDEFVEFGLTTWGNAVVDRKLLRATEHVAEQRFISKAEFARRFGLRKPAMDRMIARGTVVTKKVVAGKTTRVVVDLELSQTPSESKAVVSVREAAAHLGLPVSVLSNLRDARVYETRPHSVHEHSWHKDEVERFLARIHGLAVAASPPTENAVALGEVLRLKLRDASAKADIVAAVLEGRLPVIGRNSENFAGLLLNRLHVGEFICSKRREIEGNSYSLQDAAKHTGLDFMVLRNAIELGLLSGNQHGGRLRVTAESVEQFNAEYVLLSRVAAKLGTLAQHLWRRCRQHGIPVIALARSNGLGEQPVLLRSSEAPLLEICQAERLLKGNTEARYENKQSAYESALRKYFDMLLKKGERLPRRAGQPNKAAIAKACEFSRDVLYSYPTLVALLEEFDRAECAQTGEAAGAPMDYHGR